MQDAGEPGLNGVTLQLLKGGNVVATTTTAMAGNLNGAYLFSGLCAGAYTVQIVAATVPAGFTATTANAPGSTLQNDSSNSPVSVVLPSDSASDRTVDFGCQLPCSGAIGNFVWHDMNANGIQDAGEPGIPLVTINLRNPGGQHPAGDNDHQRKRHLYV